MDKLNPREGFVSRGDGSVIPISEWKEQVKAGSVDFDSEYTVCKTFSVDIEKGSSSSRTVKTVISDGRKDRDNDTINPEGWLLSDYEKNPVVLWAHNPEIPPIAKSQVKSFKSKLVSIDTFPDEGVSELADTVLALVKGGFINAKSVGFFPTDYQFDEKRGGFDFKEQELLEHSYVPVPANPRALIVARSQGINTQPLIKWAEYTLDTWKEHDSGLVTRSEVEDVWSFANDSSNEVWATSSEPITNVTFVPSVIGVQEEQPEKDMDEKEVPESTFSDETRHYLDQQMEMKRLEKKLKEEGFSEKEIGDTLSRVREMESIEAPEVEEKKEDEIVADESVVREVVNDVVQDLKSSITEITGRVH